jgi:hypothetical protein
MAVLYGDEKSLVLKPVQLEIAFNSSNAIAEDPKFITYSDQILTSNQRSEVYGDLGDISMVARATNNIKIPGIYTNIISDYTVTMGNDTLSFESNHHSNVLYGDMRDLTMLAVGGISSDGVITQANVFRNTFSFGTDIITAGDGNNIVYGDARNLLLQAEKGYSLDGQTVPSTITGTNPIGPLTSTGNNTFTFALDTITLGNGNNTVYGDVADISILAPGGKVDPSETLNFSMTTRNNSLAFTFAGDQITVGDGNNIIYGDFANWVMAANGGDTYGKISPIILTDTNGAIQAISSTMVGDLIKLGDGNNTVYADGKSLLLDSVSGQGFGGSLPLSIITGLTYTFGNDTVQASVGKTAAGANIIYGDLQDLTFQALGELAINSLNGVSAQIRVNTISLGADTITLGDGGNTVYGDLKHLSFIAIAGMNEDPGPGVSRISIRSNTTNFGDDTITSGDGNDMLVGDAADVLLLAQGGHAVDVSSSATLDIRLGVKNIFQFGKDVINAGDGDDTIVGDVETLTLHAKGGTVTGEGLAADGIVKDTLLTFGEDKLFGGAGDDTIYGDLETLTHIQELGLGGNAVVVGNIVNFAIDEIFGGAGDDVLAGDVSNTNDLAAYLADNTLIHAADLFIYDGSINNGNDTVLDYDIGLDKLKSVNGAVFSDGGLNGNGHLVVNVEDEASAPVGTIILLNVTDFSDVVII